MKKEIKNEDEWVQESIIKLIEINLYKDRGKNDKR